MTPETAWRIRAATAERAVLARHLRRLWAVPGTRLGIVRRPSRAVHSLYGTWNYWWQAHLLDCLIDAQQREPDSGRARLISCVRRAVWLRNPGWLNRYYDDIAWMGLALQRFGATRPVRVIAKRIMAGWTDAAGGGIWWRLRDDFKNVPANGPAAIMLARAGQVERARAMTEWMETRLRDPETGLMWDGLRVNAAGEVYTVEKAIYTYCQGVHLGACVEMALLEPEGPWADRAARTIRAVRDHLSPNGILRGHEGGDGGLFTGILVRYLADSAIRLPAAEGELAARLVLDTATAAWDNKVDLPDGPLFGHDFAQRAKADGPEQDLSVQLTAWMVFEAAANLEARGLTG